MTRHEKVFSALGAVVLVAVAALAFRGYLSPGMLVEFVVRLCT
jgi:hypothetical protein